MSIYKSACKEKGITEGTEKFGACVMDLYKNKDKLPVASKKNDKMAPYKSTCSDIGFKEGTEKFGECVLKLYSRNKDKKKAIQVKKTLNQEQYRKRKLQELELQKHEQRLRIEKERLALEKNRIERDKRKARSDYLLDLGDKLQQKGKYAPPPPPQNRNMNCMVIGNMLSCN